MPTVTRKQIDARHPEWKQNCDLWINVALMYEGGAAMKHQAIRFLEKRPKEGHDVYAFRLRTYNYENNIGAGLGWHESSMFEKEPVIDFRTPTQEGTAEATLSPDQDAFYKRFLKNCDRAGTTYVNLFRRVFTSMLLNRHCYVAIDLPSVDPSNPPVSLQAQRDSGLLDPYLCVVSPIDIINWERDEDGNFEWAVVYSRTTKQNFLAKSQLIERWYYYDKTDYRVYESITEEGDNAISSNLTVQSIGQDAADNTPVELKDEGKHALAAQNTVPLIELGVQEGWWMANRAYLPAMRHINITAALDWSLFMAGLAMPVISSDKDLSSQVASETGFIQLEAGGKFGFAEPSGNSWQALQARGKELKEEIWRTMYLVAQARNTSATAQTQSGASKEQDMQPSHDVMNGLGDVLRAGMQLVLDMVAKVRASNPGGEKDADLQFEVRGFSFEDKSGMDDVEIITDVLALNVPSKTFEKKCDKLLVQATCPDASPDELRTMFEEIDAAPTRSEIAEQQQQKQQELLQKQMTGIGQDDPEGIAP